MTDGMGVTRRTRQRQTQPPPKQAAKECLGHAYDPSTRAGASLPSSNRPRVLRRGACRCELTRGEEKKKNGKEPNRMDSLFIDKTRRSTAAAVSLAANGERAKGVRWPGCGYV